MICALHHRQRNIEITIDECNFNLYCVFSKMIYLQRVYFQTSPPVYDIPNMDVPVMMFHGTNDWLVSEPDIYKLENETKNLVSKKLVSGWEHLDFIWAMNAPSQCYSDIISTFKQSL